MWTKQIIFLIARNIISSFIIVQIIAVHIHLTSQLDDKMIHKKNANKRRNYKSSPGGVAFATSEGPHMENPMEVFPDLELKMVRTLTEADLVEVLKMGGPIVQDQVKNYQTDFQEKNACLEPVAEQLT